MKDYTIFDHAQQGHVAPVEVKPAAVVSPIMPKLEAKKRVRRPVGWAVEAQLGLGEYFRKVKR